MAMAAWFPSCAKALVQPASCDGNVAAMSSRLMGDKLELARSHSQLLKLKRRRYCTLAMQQDGIGSNAIVPRSASLKTSEIATKNEEVAVAREGAYVTSAFDRGGRNAAAADITIVELEDRETADAAAALVAAEHDSSEDEKCKADVQKGNKAMRWSMLLSREALEEAHLSRASSVTDAHVLRRKGRLKEQDGLIEFIISMHRTHSSIQVMEKMEQWIREHTEDPMRSTLSKLIPGVGKIYTPLPLVKAFHDYDEFASLSRRKYVPPNFAEIRHVLNIAQVHAIAEDLSLVTFDADGTIYSDGHHIERDNKMIAHIIKLMQYGIHVVILTAAGYPGDAAKFEHRFAGLLSAFEELELPSAITRYFHVMGGECNYLLSVNSDYRLQFVPNDLWKTEDMLRWSEDDITLLLDQAERALQTASARLRLPVEFIRKPRAVGIIPKQATIYEVLEEMALTVQIDLLDSKLPYCAFNGGNDVFVDVGNKSIGLGALMNYLGKKPHETLHVGDRFTVSGNDTAARSKCPILWVANPEETGFFTRLLRHDIRLKQQTLYIE